MCFLKVYGESLTDRSLAKKLSLAGFVLIWYKCLSTIFPSEFMVWFQMILMSKTGSIFRRINFSLVFMGEMSAGHSCMYCRALLMLFLRAVSTDCCSLLSRNSLFLPSVYLSDLQRHSVTSVPLCCLIKMAPCTALKHTGAERETIPFLW